MHSILPIYKKEMRSFFTTPMAYIFLVVFALVTGYFFTNTFFLYNQSDMRSLFSIIPLVYLFFIPAVSMGLISREKSLGTIEIITTLPIRERDIVIGKYLAGLSLILIALLTTMIHYFTLINVGTVTDHGAVFTGYLGLALLGGVYTAVGIFASSITENQVVAFIVGIAIVLVFFLMDKLLVFVPASLAGIIQYLSTEFHLSNISRGVIDTRNLIYFGSVIGFFLFMTTRVLESRKWS
ncbi:MAG: ABC transporter permease subunit [Candidatus Marinimicrobia bacterium]|jgi:ABC-2 type transport system permease protein|nr:ABC transporter permease subunit [Candidatus Neomarinimicrobiota bacterium]MBT3946221.1 ABC transporter permease subunit [Candidatus Neomarinimicrobiota bacterium]MBT4154237.1 ABC transporter permease subunit [Candidatus Neomarinimicrobiota bacterium]MBT4554949.1 ABC transporter permease subunit [Candidatus Neomarinimicrobiota bacterium]MBT4753354.1 ABC transporter permease subunit [Candidatus Neomarinimicrobiota bacterium]|tara:strand:+ start:1190 stop:1903 length:714 start_codon:yes stop_codon:yes gene_type:complete